MNSPFHSDSPEADSMEAVRDLLFGKKSVEIDERFKSLERDLISTIQRIEDRLERKVDALDQSVQGEVSLLNRRVDTEVVERKDEAESLGEMVETYRKVTAKRFSDVENARRRGEAKLRKNTDDESARLSREIKSVGSALKKRILAEIESVRDEHLDLEEMGKLLVGLGKKLDPTQPPPRSDKKGGRVTLAR